MKTSKCELCGRKVKDNEKYCYICKLNYYLGKRNLIEKGGKNGKNNR